MSFSSPQLSDSELQAISAAARWYARLRGVEAKVEEGLGERDELLNELDELDRVTNGITVPLAHADELFALRNNIDAVRRRLLAKRPG